MATALEALDAELDSTTRALLGDTITYTLPGQAPMTFAAIVDYGERVEPGGQAVSDDVTIEVPFTKVPEPSNRDVIDLPKLTGRFKPLNWLRNEAGDGWLIKPVELPA
jgi:hypothetical protein